MCQAVYTDEEGWTKASLKRSREALERLET